jgi:hypothetical protein
MTSALSAASLTVTDEQLEIVFGALGLRYADKPYRNRFNSPPGAYHHDDCLALCKAGIMLQTHKPEWFIVTDDGIKLAMEKKERAS